MNDTNQTPGRPPEDLKAALKGWAIVLAVVLIVFVGSYLAVEIYR